MPETLQKEIVIRAPVEKVFSFMDDLSKTGMLEEKLVRDFLSRAKKKL